ncbi:hypothetical protein AB5I41_05900 [Sphingomonas sp. MMS24-JH45]
MNEGYEGYWRSPSARFPMQDLPRPTVSIFEQRKQDWLSIVGEGIEHID